MEYKIDAIAVEESWQDSEYFISKNAAGWCCAENAEGSGPSPFLSASLESL